ncbi:MAG: serine/threonine protein phosphatase [Polyangiaceae bacterium]|nr:serine/threonine protein phosphatase [Polyangiaceae bacterium]
MISFSNDPKTAEEQMHAVIFYLTAFGYIDGDFDSDEKDFVRDYIAKLVRERASQALGDDVATAADVSARWTKHFHEVLDEVDASIQANFDEPVADGEDSKQFVIAKLKLRCYELFKGFDEDNRAQLLATVDALMHADGVVHPNELRFREDVAGLLDAPMDLDDAEIEVVEAGEVLVNAARKLPAREVNHPWFDRSERDYGNDPATVGQQTREDMELIDRVMAKLDEQRQGGRGRLVGAQDVSEFAGQPGFLDGHVYVEPPKPGREYELLVLGDLHGCYSCLKAALLQADFFRKVQAHSSDPERAPDMKLVLLGDYIDRGRFSYNGILRTVMHLFLTVPESVYMLRGNHEYYVQLNGRVYGGVRPAEAINSLQGLAPDEVFEAYMRLFEALPNMLLFDRTLFVHAGIPRDDTLAQKWLDLASLNDPEIRFQMLWSDPSEAEYIPLELQKANARFPFGKRQFKSFMSRVGANTLVRGHERVIEGWKTVYDLDGTRLLNLFSAGGRTNRDLPESSNYREVVPMALTLKHKDGVTQLTPFVIDYERYNDPKYNAFFKS